MGKKRPYKFVGHTADVEFIAYGKSIEECFRNAFLAMFETMSYVKKIASSRSAITTLHVKDTASGMDDLLWYSLQDAVSLLDSKSLFAYRVKSIRITKAKGKYHINAEILCRRRGDKDSKLDVKGVSRYNMSVKNAKGEFAATVVLDV